jgi:hypothetical protein
MGKAEKATKAFARAIERDNAWFRDHPSVRVRRRDIDGAELPRRMRGRGIKSVIIERAGPSTFIRTFLDAQGQPIFSGIDMYEDQVVPSAPSHPVSIKPSDDGKTVSGISVNRDAALALDLHHFESTPNGTQYQRPASRLEVREALHPPPNANIADWGGTVTVSQVAPGVCTRSVELFRVVKSPRGLE